jgi:6-phosphofructo-2-kinase / fructose-2,6-biphosphatase 2
MNKYKLIIAFVGLPASGKSYTSHHLCQYLSWLGYKIKIFNSGNYRRLLSNEVHNADFFNNNNNENLKLREKYFYYSIFDLNSYLQGKEQGEIAILDATNSTKKRREKIIHFFSLFPYEKNILFLENITNNNLIIQKNIDFKKNSPDYKDFTIEFMKNDFEKRFNYYRDVYEDIDDNENLNYIKIYNCGKKVMYNNVYGFVETLILNYLINFTVSTKKIFISRHGQSLYNLENRIGGDSSISNEGMMYARKLYNYISLNYKKDEIMIFTSKLKRTKETAQLFIENGFHVKHMDILNEINGGICENMTYDEVKEKYPDLYDERKKNKFYYKYPEGESYFDLIIRLKEFILELNRMNKTILIISHNAVIRVLMAYYLKISHHELPYFNMPLHKLFCIENSNSNYCYTKQEIL